jgi:hypothetical protein
MGCPVQTVTHSAASQWDAFGDINENLMLIDMQKRERVLRVSKRPEQRLERRSENIRFAGVLLTAAAFIRAMPECMEDLADEHFPTLMHQPAKIALGFALAHSS